MATCTAGGWSSSAPKVVLYGWEESSDQNNVVLAYSLHYIASSPAYTSAARAYTINIGSTRKTGTFGISGKTGDIEITSGTVTIPRETTGINIAWSVSFDFRITWSGQYVGTADSNIDYGWIGAKYSYVRYDTLGGSAAPATQTKYWDSDMTLSSEWPTKQGQNFQGWSTTSGGSVSYTPGSNYAANGDATLYAVWKPVEYNVIFDANGGINPPTKQIKKYGIELPLTTKTPTKENYNFLGWSTSQNGTIIAYNPGDKYKGNSAITLYAVWELAYLKPRITNVEYERMKYISSSDKKRIGIFDISPSGNPLVILSDDYITDEITIESVIQPTDVLIYEIKKSSSEPELTLSPIYIGIDALGRQILYMNEDDGTEDELIEDDTGSIIKIEFDWETDYDLSNIRIDYSNGDVSKTITISDKYSGRADHFIEFLGINDEGLTCETSWTIIISIFDVMGSNQYMIDVRSAIAVIDSCTDGEQIGVSIGKTAESVNLFDIGLPTRIRDNASFDRNVTFKGTTVFDAGMSIVPVSHDLESIYPWDIFPWPGDNGLFRCGNVCQLSLAASLYDMPTVVPWNDTIIFTLPIGYRPIRKVMCNIMFDGPQDLYTRVTSNLYIVIFPDGKVCIETRAGSSVDFNAHRGEWGNPLMFISSTYITIDDYPNIK